MEIILVFCKVVVVSFTMGCMMLSCILWDLLDYITGCMLLAYILWYLFEYIFEDRK